MHCFYLFIWICGCDDCQSESLGMLAEDSKCGEGVWYGLWLYISRTNGSILCLSMWAFLPHAMPRCPCDSLYCWYPCEYTNCFPISMTSLYDYLSCMLSESLLFPAVPSIFLIRINDWRHSKWRDQWTGHCFKWVEFKCQCNQVERAHLSYV